MCRKKLVKTAKNTESNIPPLTEDIALEQLAEAIRNRRVRLRPRECSADEIRIGGLANVFVGPGSNLTSIFVGPGNGIPDVFVGPGLEDD